MPDWFDRVPKVEIHLHLEGAIPHEALWKLILKYGGDATVPDFEALKSRFKYTDFAHFLQTWGWKNRFLREYEDFSFAAEAVARDLARQNVLYAEVFFSPPDFAKHGLSTQKLTEAVRAGLAQVPEVRVGLVADLVRDFGPERAAVTLSEVSEVRREGVIGIGIGGSEQSFPPEPFSEVFERARKLGFHTSAHAGEAAGAESVWGAVHSLHVDRIGHGIRAQEDGALLDLLAERQIPLEMCPISNLRTGVVGTMAEHPIRRLFDRGLLVTVNTDDPKMFGNSLALEYRCLEADLGFTRNEIRRLIVHGIRSTWLPDDEKRQLTDSVCRNPTWLE
jgi:adenosine deaminase